MNMSDLLYNIRQWNQSLDEQALKFLRDFGDGFFFLKEAALRQKRRIEEKKAARSFKKFDRKLKVLLDQKAKSMPELVIPLEVFERLTMEMYKLLHCSLASKRTPDEIVYGLKNDLEMREEVISMLLNQIDSSVALKEQRFFLDTLLGADEDLAVLLASQNVERRFLYSG